MSVYSICVVGGWCGNRMVIVAEHLQQLITNAGYPCKVTHHSVWENYSTPPRADLVLQLLPAYTEAETGCPIIPIRPLLLDLNDPKTIARVMDRITADFSQQRLPVAGQTP
jgi:hypothetical protein